MTFTTSKPIWLHGHAKTMNCFAAFVTELALKDISNIDMKIAGHTIFKVYINDSMVYFGPDRTAHEYARIRTLHITPYLTTTSINQIKVYVCGYNINGYGQINQPSFIQIEIVQGEQLLKQTKETCSDFKAYELPFKEQKIQRYSYQRGFLEAYHITPNDFPCTNQIYPEAKIENQPEPKYIRCTTPIPDYTTEDHHSIYTLGKLIPFENQNPLFRDRAISKISATLLGFPLETKPTIYTDLLHNYYNQKITHGSCKLPLKLTKQEYAILRFKRNYSGFIQLHLKAKEKSKVAITFDEILTNESVNHLRLSASNIIFYTLETGEYHLETMEPYTFQYLQINLLEGDIEILSASIRHLRHAATQDIQLQTNDQELHDIFTAALETFRQNAIDIFLDCPSRERAGWLCDSFFTGHTEKLITGGNPIEKAFLENYQIADGFKFLPKGMIAMCYPSDSYNGSFIPNWAMWFILEVASYTQRSGDNDFVKKVKTKIEGILQYFIPFENEQGLLEDLEGWVFIEWSQANHFTQGVHYPSNMLYAAALDAAGTLYHNQHYQEKAQKIRAKILLESFDGTFFRDHSIRQNEQIVHQDDYSETCQYFAFYFGLATPQTHPSLWEILVSFFGVPQKEEKNYSKIHPSNAFIGNLLRLDLLGRYGHYEQQISEIKEYYGIMAKETGTLWENKTPTASLNHGFASYLTYLIVRDTLGISIDKNHKTVNWRRANWHKNHLKLTLPIEDSFAHFEIVVQNQQITFLHQIPAGYQLNINN